MNRCNLLPVALVLLLTASPAQASDFSMAIPILAMILFGLMAVTFIPVWAMTRHLGDATKRRNIRLSAVLLIIPLSALIFYVPEHWPTVAIYGLPVLITWAITLVLVRCAG